MPVCFAHTGTVKGLHRLTVLSLSHTGEEGRKSISQSSQRLTVSYRQTDTRNPSCVTLASMVLRKSRPSHVGLAVSTSAKHKQPWCVISPHGCGNFLLWCCWRR